MDTGSFALTSKAILVPTDLDGTSSFRGYHPLLFLDKLLSDPRIADYVTKIQISNFLSDIDGRDYDDEDVFINQQRLLEAVMATRRPQVAALGAACPWLDDERRERWQEALLLADSQPHVVGILLTILPNLESITITNMSLECYPITEIVSAVAAANRDPDAPLHGKALTKVLEVSLDCSEVRRGGNFAVYAPFTALPSLRSIHGRMIDGNTVRRPADPLCNDIEEIKIIFSSVDLGSWKWMLKHIKNLKRFSYHHNGSGGAACDSRGIVDLLRQYASHSLRKLDLTKDDPNHWNQPDTYIGDLKDFKILRVLRLDDTSFQRAPGQVMRLVDMLPASIRVVRLLAQIESEAVDLFKGLVEGKQEILPELKRVCLEGNYNLPFSLIEKCREVAVEISGPCIRIYE
ncbi:MAG: hypothetical protein Q9209_002084 [Squamulea sp. 1 TL-2023]